MNPIISSMISFNSNVFVNIHEYDNQIICISYLYVDGFYLSIYLIPSLVLYGNGQLKI